MCHDSAAGWCLLGATIRNNPFPSLAFLFLFFLLSPEPVYLRAARLQSTRESALITVAVKTQVIVLEQDCRWGDDILHVLKMSPRGLIYTLLLCLPGRTRSRYCTRQREQCWLMFTRAHAHTHMHTNKHTDTVTHGEEPPESLEQMQKLLPVSLQSTPCLL